MAYKKEVIILSSEHNKAMLKMVSTTDESVKCTCSLDFEPHYAKLHILADRLEVVDIKSAHQQFELNIGDTSNLACMIDDTSKRLFGSNGGKKMTDIEVAINEYKESAEKEMIRDAETLGESTSLNRHGAFEEIETVLANTAFNDTKTFYQAVKPQIDEMFVCYPNFEPLDRLVPDSKWVKIETNNDFYVVGLIYESEHSGNRPENAERIQNIVEDQNLDKDPKQGKDPKQDRVQGHNSDQGRKGGFAKRQKVEFICYGIPGNISNTPPDDMIDSCSFLPLANGRVETENSHTNNHGHEVGIEKSDNNQMEQGSGCSDSGFWIIYQSAETGKIII